MRCTCVGLDGAQFLAAMSWQFRVSIFRAQTLFPLILFALAIPLAMFTPYALAASKTPARIAIVGTDDQVYVCSGECSKSECITCPVKGMQVRARSGIR